MNPVTIFLRARRHAVNLRCLAVIVFALVVAPPAQAGGWTQPRGSWYSKLSVTALSTDSYHTGEGHAVTTAEFSRTAFDLYAEYGVTERLTGAVRLPLIESSSFTTSETHRDVGDLGLEARYGLLRGAIPVAVALRVEIPTGDANGLTALRDNPEGFVRLPTGDNETTWQPTLSVSRSFHPVNAYATADLGYALRGNGFTDEYRVDLEAGWRAPPGVWVRGTAGTTGPVKDPDPARALDAANGRGEGVQVTRLGAGLGYEPVPGLAVLADVFTQVGRIVNAYGGTWFTLGVSWQRRPPSEEKQP